ncbi:putative ankyrin repeat protein RF_0381 [Saccostrea cucullata]|uniref:putative ankyrin repeat protein RF_0381 n=1 Tax=Saccostrea cuccullata TaxID=36930 RepID=UPI002ED3D50A
MGYRSRTNSLVADVTGVETEKEEMNELKDKTRIALESQERRIRDVFVHIRVMKKVSDILETNRYVVIKGNPGAGKTTIAMRVLTEPVLARYPHLLDMQTDQDRSSQQDMQNDPDGNTLHFVAFVGDEPIFKNMIESGCDPYSRSNHEKDVEKTFTDGQSTPLHEACTAGKLNMCKFLVSAYPHFLVVKDKMEKMSYMLLPGEDTGGNTVLHAAAWGGNIDLFKFLLEKTFDNKATTNDGNTVLHICCMNGKLNMCKYLVNTCPPFLQAKNEYGENILHAAAFGGNIDLFEFLLGKGFDIKVNLHDGKNVIILCCMTGKLEICKYFVSTYPHLLHDTDADGINALHAAAWGGNIDLFKFLLGKGFDINVSENEGKTVLHFCCLNGQLDMFMYLVKTYPQLLDVKDNEGENALHAAALGGNLAILKFLLGKGFDIKTRGGDGKTVLHRCCMNGKLDMCRFLIENYPHLLYIKDSIGVNILHAAAWGGNVDLLKFLLGKGLDIRVSSDEGKAVLHFCCINGKLDMCKYLVENYSFLLYIKDVIG